MERAITGEGTEKKGKGRFEVKGRGINGRGVGAK